MSQNISKCLSDFAIDLQNRAMDLITFKNDLESMENGIKNDKPYSRQTIEPMTRLRKDTNALKIAKDNPDVQFLRDVHHDILGI